MPEPIDQLEKVVDAAGEAVNVIHSITHGGGVWMVVQLADELSAMSGLKGDVLASQLKDISLEERKSLLARLKAKVSIGDKALEAKIESGADCLNEIVELGLKVHADVMNVKAMVEANIEDSKKIIDKIKNLVSPPPPPIPSA